MKYEVSEKFYKDVEKIAQHEIKARLEALIELIETVNRLNEIPSVKKLKGYKNAHRIRIGNYRLGVVYDGGILKLGRFLHRRGIYKYFP